MQNQSPNKSTDVYTITRLNREVKRLLENSFSTLWIEGEISNLSKPSSGHFYFCLKDLGAQISCAMFKTHTRLLTFKPENGLKVLVKARVSLYEESGRYQLIVEVMEESGAGNLQLAFEALKKRLLAEGLFDPQYKKALPAFAKQVGVITSPSGAAVKDILAAIQRHFCALSIIIYPTAVQGTKAAAEICRAIDLANQRKECDVLILARGGGSLEDLWPFNEESVARAIFNSVLPIVSGIGHEVDFTIADFAADHRAATPTAAAEMVSPNQQEIQAQLIQLESKLIRYIENYLMQKQQQVDYFEKRLIDPRDRLRHQAQQLNLLHRALVQQQLNYLKHQYNYVMNLTSRLNQHSPLTQIQQSHNQCQLKLQQLTARMQQTLTHHATMLAKASASLEAYSPLATLNRGYAIVSNEQGQILHASGEVQPLDKVNVMLGKGKLVCNVETIAS